MLVVIVLDEVVTVVVFEHYLDLISCVVHVRVLGRVGGDGGRERGGSGHHLKAAGGHGALREVSPNVGGEGACAALP